MKKNRVNANSVIKFWEEITGEIMSLEKFAEVCIIPELCQTNGVVVSKDICIQGYFEGKLVSTGWIITLEESVLEAELQAMNITIGGSFSGVIRAKGVVTLLDNSFVKGKIICDVLEMEPGARFTGALKRQQYPEQYFSPTA